MSYHHRVISKVLVVTAVGVVAFALVVGAMMMAGQKFFPAGDVTFEIANGYRYADSGGHEKLIYYHGSNRPAVVVIDARVDDFVLENDVIRVARRPRVSKLAADGAADSWLLPQCEYWTIHIHDHRVERTDDQGGLRCQ